MEVHLVVLDVWRHNFRILSLLEFLDKGLLCFVANEAAILTAETLVYDLEVVGLHFEESCGDDAVGRLLCLGKHQRYNLASIMNVINEAVELDAA